MGEAPSLLIAGSGMARSLLYPRLGSLRKSLEVSPCLSFNRSVSAGSLPRKPLPKERVKGENPVLRHLSHNFQQIRFLARRLPAHRLSSLSEGEVRGTGGHGIASAGLGGFGACWWTEALTSFSTNFFFLCGLTRMARRAFSGRCVFSPKGGGRSSFISPVTCRRKGC